MSEEGFVLIGHRMDCTAMRPHMTWSDDGAFYVRACSCGGMPLTRQLDARGDWQWLPEHATYEEDKC